MNGRRALLLILLLALVAGAWLATKPAAPSASTVPESASIAAESSSRSNAELAPLDQREGALAERSPAASGDARVSEDNVALALTLFDAATGERVTRWTFASLREFDGELRLPNSISGAELSFTGLAPRTFLLTIVADGYRTLEQWFDLTNKLGQIVRQRVELACEARITLRARAIDGRPFPELAAEFELSTQALAAGAFSAYCSWQAPDAKGRQRRDARSNGVLVDIERPASESIDVGLIGVLRGNSFEGARIGLALSGQILEWKRVTNDDEELVFTLSPDELRAAFARLAFRVVDARTREPLTTATASLEAHDPESQRNELAGLAVDEQGCEEVHALAEGAYTLVISADGYSEHRAHVAIERGTTLDLGKIALELSQPLRVRVSDRDGRPLLARVHVGPFEPGVALQHLLSKRFVTTDEAGIARIAAPASIVIVRAIVLRPIEHALPETPSRIVIVDPARLPSTLEIEVYEPSLVEVLSGDDKAVKSLRVETGSGIHIATSGGPALLLYVQPDRYVAVGLAADGREIARRAFEVIAGQSVTISLP